MIIAQAFNRSGACRDSEFSTCDQDLPLIVQFAANQPNELAAAAEKVARHGVRVVDLNCGCPQSWAMQDG
jgi:tRNA-dihydrouridine synthase 4